MACTFCQWNVLQWGGGAFAILLFIFIAARLVSAAYFMSKHDHELRTGKVDQHEPR